MPIPRFSRSQRARCLAAACSLVCLLGAGSAEAEDAKNQGTSPGERAALAGEEPQAALAAPQLSPPPDTSALTGKPIKRVDVVTVGSRWSTSLRITKVRAGEPFEPSAARTVMRELTESGQFARVTVEAIAEGDGVVLRAHVLPRRLVASIRLSGATLDRAATLDAARVREGGEITSPMLTEIGQRIRRYYADHGYPQANVTSDVSDTDDPNRVVLRIDIDAGAPRTVTRRYFVITPGMEREVNGLEDRYRLGVGARIDEPLLEEADRELAEVLRENGFYRADVKHVVRLSASSSELFVYVTPGPRIVPVFEGNRSVDEVELSAAIAPKKGLEQKTQELVERLTRFYVQRGFFDARVVPEERGGPNDPVHHLVLRIDEGDQVRVVQRIFPCLPKTWNAEQVRGEIDSFLVEDLPGDKGFSLKDPNAVSALFGGRGPRAVARPLDLNPVETYAPETYERALKHLKDLAYSKGYLNAVVGPVQLERATCSARSPAGRCIPEPREPNEAVCAKDALGLPLPEPDPPQTLVCRPDPVKHVECSREIALRIPMHLGPQTLLHDVAFEGSRTVSEQALFETSRLELGKPLSTIELEAARLRLVESYRDRGYAFVEVKASIEPSPDRTRARARFAITERDQVIVGGFVVRGALRTSEELILRRIALEEGKPFVERDARRSEERIGSLGAFSSVSVGLEDPEVPQKQKRVLVTVTEQVPQYLDPRVGFSTGEGLRFAVEYGHKNIAGLAIALTLRVQLSYLFDFIVVDPGVRADYEKKLSVGQQLERRNTASITFPEIGLGPLVSLSVDGIDVRDNQRGFGITRQALVPTLAYRPSRTITMRLGASAEVNEVDVFNETAIDSPIIPLLRVPFGSTFAVAERINFAWDGRNSAFAATKGALVALGVEHVNALPTDEGEATINSHFLRMSGRVAGYFELSSKGPSIAMSLAAGYNLQLKDGSSTYPDRLFFLGGVDTIRAFLADALVPEDVARGLIAKGQTTRSAVLANVPIRGGDLSINPRLELRVPVTDLFQAGFFLDTGNLWKEPTAIDFTLRYALGGGLRITTPIGPLALDYGFNLNRRQWEDIGAFHFSIGLF
ncbi:POTRA domain-containing protein [Polyangium jinanense]|uniref:BamA/TamA family outer membrane protein n=1 Tax=Polyangium jinanense TaxID=2829994 RepID=A0A9X4AYF1_9BACT|nr:outer membrane protein assembly factor [Polyangium jinanense]MDC3956849.1 BamA/TamA family outer membrane protein [Polyangium jinanense]MDC3957680.1 BamA/TamA family outer membrane protein [Polyangium jinanense]MDC3987112.1 BamA/TamA family outer membrane protein [Polyangium jinanense]